MIEFEKDLNPEQLAAATAPDGPLLILAAAGTGKTRTLVYRVAYLVETKQVDPGRILLLTFTNRAAREMLARACALVQRNVGGLWGGTFHHMANRILRRHARILDYPENFTILDRDDTLSLIKQCVVECRLKDKEFPKAEVLASLFSATANTEIPLATVIANRFPGEPVNGEGIERVQGVYLRKKKSIGAMDFDDLLVNGLRLFREQVEILQQYQERFLYTLVDEYQDTNTIQAEWVDLIAARHRNLLVVGDDFQSIYSWRGADYRNIMSFPERYADTRTFLLETNYRSVPDILDVANACIAGNPRQFQKTLRGTRDRYHRPMVVRTGNGAEQARWVIDQVQRLRREGYRLSDMAVLYRAHFHAMELQMELARGGVPFVITSGARFFEQAHIKDVCALLRLYQSPGDELAFHRLLLLLPKVGDKTAAKVWAALNRKFDPQAGCDREKVRQRLPTLAQATWQEIDRVLQGVEAEGLQVQAGEIIRRFVEAYYRRYAMNHYENYDRRLEDLQELIAFTTRFQSLEQFLSEMALQSNLDAEAANDAGLKDNSLRLSTVHQAKGLEWAVVFVLWAAEGMFPSGRALTDGDQGDEEERRLFYVAVTRAKDELFFGVPDRRRTADGHDYPVLPSRFLREIPGDLLQEKRIWL